MTRHGNTRRVVALVCVLALITPTQVNAGLGISFDLFSVGPFSLGIDLTRSLPILGLLAVGALVYAVFKGSGSSSYSSRYPGNEPQVVEQTISISPDDHLTGEVIRIRLTKYDWFDAKLFDQRHIPLPDNAYLEIEEDGKMRFKDCAFEGYIYWHYDDTFSAFDLNDDPVLVLQPNWSIKDNGDPLHLLLLEQSPESTEALGCLTGPQA